MNVSILEVYFIFFYIIIIIFSIVIWRKCIFLICLYNRYGLQDYGISVTTLELDQLFKYFDRDKNGFIDITEFLVGIKGDMNKRRKQLVRLAFNILDTDGSGTVSLEELSAVYDFSWHPDVKSGKKTIREAAKEFMRTWDNDDGKGDGIITYAEFEDYYKEISASIDDDDYFELMIRNAWRIAGGEGMAANTANKRVLVTDANGKQSVVCVNNELGVKAGDKSEIMKRLQQQGVNASNVELYGGVDNTKKASNTKQPPVGLASGAATNKPVSSSGVESGRNGISTTNTANASVGQTASDLLAKLLYTPPCSLEQLGAKLQVSVVSNSPSVLKGSFISRYTHMQ